jgi:hypothetical protein
MSGIGGIKSQESLGIQETSVSNRVFCHGLPQEAKSTKPLSFKLFFTQSLAAISRKLFNPASRLSMISNAVDTGRKLTRKSQL